MIDYLRYAFSAYKSFLGMFYFWVVEGISRGYLYLI